MDRNGGRGFYVGAGLATGLIPRTQEVDGQKVYRPWEWPMPGTEDFRKCDPEEYLNPWVRMISEFADGFDSGFLPWPGGVMDQPAKLMEGIRIYRGAINHCQNRIVEGHERAREACGVG